MDEINVLNEIDVTVVIPAIPPRVDNLLQAAVDSVRTQTARPLGGISCALDTLRAGAAVTRQRALDGVRTGWVAFLDDDDYWYPNHLETLWNMVKRSGTDKADYAYSWFDGNNPFPAHRGRQMNIDEPHHTTMTVLVRTDIARAAGFLQPDGPMDPQWAGEDWQFELRCIAEIRRRHGDRDAPTRIVGTPDVTWFYRVHRGNTSGLATRW